MLLLLYFASLILWRERWQQYVEQMEDGAPFQQQQWEYPRNGNYYHHSHYSTCFLHCFVHYWSSDWCYGTPLRCKKETYSGHEGKTHSGPQLKEKPDTEYEDVSDLPSPGNINLKENAAYAYMQHWQSLNNNKNKIKKTKTFFLYFLNYWLKKFILGKRC